MENKQLLKNKYYKIIVNQLHMLAILTILSKYYGGSIIRTYIIGGLAALVTIYSSFIVLSAYSAYLRSDI